MTLNDKHAGEVIRAARQKRGYTYRRMEELGDELVERDPDRFERVPKTVVWRMETQGPNYFLEHATGPGKIRSVIELLFSGDPVQFYKETGLSVIDVQAERPDDAAPEVAMYLEMESPESTRRVIPAPVSCDFVVEARTSRMMPAVAQGQSLYCLRAEVARPGEIAVLDIPGEGLTLATALSEGRYRFERTKREFTLSDGGRLYGVVAWLRPVLPV